MTTQLPKPTTDIKHAMDALADAIFSVQTATLGDPGLRADNTIVGTVSNLVDTFEGLHNQLNDNYDWK